MMKTYSHNGPGGPVRAEDASKAAALLAKRQYGRFGGVESFRMVSSKWVPGGPGWGEVGCKVWEALLVTVPSPMMISEGAIGQPQDYVRRTRLVRLAQSVKDLAAPARDVGAKLPNGKYSAPLMRSMARAGQ